ncbi:hypothetical protein FF100_10140 [Methylobacterium terricola]|uniref:Uncharacterized protein n=1 Tax=Methylobacterium terricola TaxID=2583531 RepID=A0A5C4LML3_9HYPH|nr:hypothetical protein [Methylobacterium terricola]TNC14496.1 hypothetical protein FF100_10140 [Methylobacterium terricola]
MPRHAAVIGAGIVGVPTAHEPVRDGVQVVRVEPGGPQATACGLSPAPVVPVPMPGLGRKGPGDRLGPTGP